MHQFLYVFVRTEMEGLLITGRSSPCNHALLCGGVEKRRKREAGERNPLCSTESRSELPRNKLTNLNADHSYFESNAETYHDCRTMNIHYTIVILALLVLHSHSIRVQRPCSYDQFEYKPARMHRKVFEKFQEPDIAWQPEFFASTGKSIKVSSLF